MKLISDIFIRFPSVNSPCSYLKACNHQMSCSFKEKEMHIHICIIEKQFSTFKVRYAEKWKRYTVCLFFYLSWVDSILCLHDLWPHSFWSAYFSNIVCIDLQPLDGSILPFTDVLMFLLTSQMMSHPSIVLVDVHMHLSFTGGQCTHKYNCYNWPLDGV